MVLGVVSEEEGKESSRRISEEEMKMVLGVVSEEERREVVKPISEEEMVLRVISEEERKGLKPDSGVEIREISRLISEV